MLYLFERLVVSAARWLPAELSVCGRFRSISLAICYTGSGYGKENDAKKASRIKIFYDAEKFATELTKYLELTLKRNSNLRRSYLLGIRGREATRKFRPLKVNLKDSVERHKLAMLLEKA
jgi:hypothetical protein